MTVYHGSYTAVECPDTKHSRDNLDFGRGFYVTAIKEQASKWARRFAVSIGKGVVTAYLFDYETCKNNYKTKEFDTYSEEWLDFVLKSRKGESCGQYDVVAGGIANDKVFNTVELYYDGLINRGAALRRLRYEKPNVQICIKKQEVLDGYLHYLLSEDVL